VRFVANFVRFQQCKNVENRLSFTQLHRDQRWELLLRHSVYISLAFSADYEHLCGRIPPSHIAVESSLRLLNVPILRNI